MIGHRSHPVGLLIPSFPSVSLAVFCNLPLVLSTIPGYYGRLIRPAPKFRWSRYQTCTSGRFLPAALTLTLSTTEFPPAKFRCH